MSNLIPWMNRLETLISDNHMLLTPFYKAWTCGSLTKEQMKDYAKEYYYHVKAFPTYLSTLHSRCEDLEIRKELLKNLVDEEGGYPNHLDLWKTFALSLGVTEEEIADYEPKAPVKKLVSLFKDSCTTSLISGLIALYCYESQIPAICSTKITGLTKWYGLKNPHDYHYFSVHETADIAHSVSEKKLLLQLVQPEDENMALAGAANILTALNEFLDSFQLYEQVV